MCHFVLAARTYKLVENDRVEYLVVWSIDLVSGGVGWRNQYTKLSAIILDRFMALPLIAWAEVVSK